MKKLKWYIVRNWFWISAGLVFTKIAVESCYEQRGGFYIGGEWLILPIILMLRSFVPAVIESVIEVFFEEDEEDAGKIKTVHNRMAR